MDNPTARTEYLTIEQVAAQIGVSARTIERWRGIGKMPEPQRLLGRLVWHPDQLKHLI